MQSDPILAPARAARSLAGLVLFVSLALGTTSHGADLSLEGVHVVPHSQSTEMRYRKAPDFSPGARVELFLRNTSPEALTIPSSTDIRLRGQTPDDLLKGDAWAWHDLPSSWGGEPLCCPRAR